MMDREEMRRAAEEMDALKDSGREFDGLVRVNAKVAKNPGAIVVLEMSGKDLSAISTAADQAGEDVSEFMRKAALARVSDLKARRKKASA
jgi:hypothetical protein